MHSSLTWIDHDPTARERALRILSLFQEKESQDASRRRYERKIILKAKSRLGILGYLMRRLAFLMT